MDHTASQALPDVGSFSYSWPTSNPQPEERVGHGNITAVATDPVSASQCSFDSRLSVSEQTEAMADAEQMFLNGLFLPLQRANQRCQCQEDGHDADHKEPMLTRSLSLDSSQRMIASSATTSRRRRLTRPASQSSSPTKLHGGTVTIGAAKCAVYRTSKLRLRLPSFGRRGRQHNCILFRILAPLYQKIVRCIWKRKATEKVMDGSRRAEYGSTKVKRCDLSQENAIRDAILHCKRSL